MATIIGCVNLSHSPFWNIVPPASEEAPGGSFSASVDRIRDAVAELRPDVIVVFGPDHARGLFYDCMPPFTIGVERVVGVGDYDTPDGELPVAGDLAREIFDGVTARGFDPAISLDMRIDHGLTQVYSKLAPGLDIPLIPVIVNSGCPPLPSFSRAFDFGRAFGEAVAAAASPARVLVVGSGGLSHWPNSTSAYDPSITEEWRDFLIRGRDRVTELEPARQAKARAIAADENLGHVNSDWDVELLQRMVEDPHHLASLDRQDVEAIAGPGAHEVRTWAAATAAWGGALSWSAYEAVPEWITGMGISASFAPVLADIKLTT